MRFVINFLCAGNIFFSRQNESHGMAVHTILYVIPLVWLKSLTCYSFRQKGTNWGGMQLLLASNFFREIKHDLCFDYELQEN